MFGNFFLVDMYNVYVGSSELRFLDAKNWRENSKKKNISKWEVMTLMW